MRGPIHLKAVVELVRSLIEVDPMDEDIALDLRGPMWFSSELHMPERRVKWYRQWYRQWYRRWYRRWYQAARRGLRLQDTMSLDNVRSNEGKKSKDSYGVLWPCYLDLIRDMQGCPFFPTFISETAVTHASEYLLDVGMQWVGGTGLLVDTVILQDVMIGHEGSDVESFTIHHLDCSASNLRRLVNKYRGTDNHRVLSWACRVKCQRGIDCMGALQKVVKMMYDLDLDLDYTTSDERRRIKRRYTARLGTLMKDLSTAFAALPGAQLLRPWPVTAGKPGQLLEEWHKLFSWFRESEIFLNELPYLICETEIHYRELLEGADLLPIGKDFDEKEGVRRVAEILFWERQEIKISSRYTPYQHPQIHVEQIRPGGVEEPIIVVPCTSIHGLVAEVSNDSGASFQLGRENLTKLFERLSRAVDSQMADERQTATLHVSRENVRDDFMWDFVTKVQGPSYDMETDVKSLFAEGPIWATTPLKYLSTEFIKQTCLDQGLDIPRNSSRSAMVKQLAQDLATSDEDQEVFFTMNKSNLDWVKPVYRPKYERRLLDEHSVKTVAALREQDSIEAVTHLYEIEDRALPLLCRQMGITSSLENDTRQNFIRSILDIPSRDPPQRTAGMTSIPVPCVISEKINNSYLSKRQKRSLLITFGKISFRAAMEKISGSQKLLDRFVVALERTPRLLLSVEDPEELEFLSAFKAYYLCYPQ